MGSHHPCVSTYAARSAPAPHAAKQHTTQVYTSGFRTMLAIPTADICHLPPSAAAAARLVLCSHFRAEDPRSCPMGSRCKFVHADTRRAQRQDIHVNYAWRRVEECEYERFSGGQTLRVAAPNSKVASDVMDSNMVLRTRALAAKRRPLTHCAHYYFNRTCNLGAQCQFIHAVFIDPSAKDGQRAPVPSQLGEGRELQLTKKQREAKQREAAVALESDAVDASTPASFATPAPTPVALLRDSVVVAKCDAQCGEFRSATTSPALAGRPYPGSGSLTAASMAPSTPSRGHSPVASDASGDFSVLPASRTSNTPSDGSASRLSGSGRPAPRYRHDPYNALGARVISFGAA